MKEAKTSGLVLFSRNYRERDKLVKIFTLEFGKRMFFVKNFAKSRFASSLQNFSASQIVAVINDNGFSFIDDVDEIAPFSHIAEDLFLNAYASYLISLADASLPDNVPDRTLYQFLLQALELLDAGFDKEIITNIFELQLLGRFGVAINFGECAYCHTKTGPFDYSYKVNGCLCPKHYQEDPRRLHLDPNVLYLCQLFQDISLDKIQKISIKPDMKQKLRHFIDGLYDDYTGLRLKAKKFLDGMDDWAGILK